MADKLDRSSQKRFQVKLLSGRIIGPINLQRAKLLILKNQITGKETAKEYPVGEWKKINRFSEFNELIMAKLEGRLSEEATSPASEPTVLRVDSENATTMKIPGLTEELASGKPSRGEHTNKTTTGSGLAPTEILPETGAEHSPEDEDEATIVGTSSFGIEEQSKTDIAEGADLELDISPSDKKSIDDILSVSPTVAREKTITISRERREAFAPKKRKDFKGKDWLRILLLGLALGYFAHETFLVDEEKRPKDEIILVKPQFPNYVEGVSNPQESEKLYRDGLKFYSQDNVRAYVKAADYFLRSASNDNNNVKALAMLASSYLNIIDSSSKDDRYFTVISKLIERSRAKSIDLPETVIADVEFFLTVGKTRAAKNRIVEYTRTRQYGVEMFYYLAIVLKKEGKYTEALNYLKQIPKNRIFSPKIHYLAAELFLKVDNSPAALEELKAALTRWPDHAKSNLLVAEIFSDQGKILSAKENVIALKDRKSLMSPAEYGEFLYLASQIAKAEGDLSKAVTFLEGATRFQPQNIDFRLELYGLKAKLGENVQKFQKQARMYFFLGKGEKLAAQGEYQEALNQFLQARRFYSESSLPLERIGDMFVALNDLDNATVNYRKAVQVNSKSNRAWSKLIKSLIESYEWDKARKALATFGPMPGAKSSANKLMGDLFSKQGKYPEAITYYKRAMASESIDSAVYIAFADSIAATGNYQDPPFFYTLARRFDPFNFEAIKGIAMSFTNSGDPRRAIEFLNEEIKKMDKVDSRLITVIGQIQRQTGDYQDAMNTAERAIKLDERVADPWLLKAKLILEGPGKEKEKFEKALEALDSYVTRNPSDPQGYLEKYRVFYKMSRFGKAAAELDKVYARFPKYPGLKYYRGSLYAAGGNSARAIKEFKTEIQNHPTNVEAYLSLGKELIKAQKLNEALGYLNRAMQLAPKNAEPKQLSGYVNYLLKNYDGAVALYKAALQFDKGNPLIYKRLGIAYRALGDIKSASGAFRKYLDLAPDAIDRKDIERYL